MTLQKTILYYIKFGFIISFKVQGGLLNIRVATDKAVASWSIDVESSEDEIAKTLADLTQKL